MFLLFAMKLKLVETTLALVEVEKSIKSAVVDPWNRSPWVSVDISFLSFHQEAIFSAVEIRENNFEVILF